MSFVICQVTLHTCRFEDILNIIWSQKNTVFLSQALQKVSSVQTGIKSTKWKTRGKRRQDKAVVVGFCVQHTKSTSLCVWPTRQQINSFNGESKLVIKEPKLLHKLYKLNKIVCFSSQNPKTTSAIKNTFLKQHVPMFETHRITRENLQKHVTQLINHHLINNKTSRG